MSVTDLPTRPELSDSLSPARRGLGVIWVRVGLVCALLVGSGALRAWQGQRIQRSMEADLRARVALDQVPLTLGSFGEWKGETREMDPEIARNTGADQVVTRRYTNSNTGVTIDVILLFGPARYMFIHAPTTCYPKAGFSARLGPEGRLVKDSADKGHTPRFEPVPFAAVIYGKGEGGFEIRQEVYWTWRYDGRWTPQELTNKQTGRTSSMIKVHTSRQILPGEVYDPAGNPSEALLRELIPALEKTLAAPAAPAT